MSKNKLKKDDSVNPQLLTDAIKEIEDSGRIELYNAMENLKENKDFKLLFTEEFFNKYPLRCIRLKQDPSVSFGEMADVQRERLDSIINASGVVQVWFKQLEAEGLNAKAQIEEIQEELQKKQAGK